MRFPELLVQVKKQEEELRALQFDLQQLARKYDDLRANLVRALPAASDWMGPGVQNGQSTVEGDDVS